MFEIMIWISGHAMRHPRMLLTYNRIAGKSLVLPLIMFLLMISWPMVSMAGNYPAYSTEKAELSSSSLRKSLLRHYYRWEGAPYRFGGNSKYGVDCSGFIHIAFRDAFGIDVPRSTQLLSNIRNRVPFRKLATGDIIIFRTSRNNLHAGIYVGNNQFIHASKSRGVILSSLNNPYWKKVYKKSVRVIGRPI
ncbi:MAG: NlpC/P60 family protein [Mariprofundaceae bacterium]